MSLSMTAVAKRYGSTTLFTNISLELHPGERVALLGQNGSGKTTLMRLAAGLEPPDAGQVTHTGRIAFLEQHADLSGVTLRDLVTPPELRRATAALAQAQAMLAHPTPEALERYAEAEDHYRRLDGYTLDTTLSRVLSGLNLPPELPTHSMSGGQTRRVMLARLLLTSADIYLLDEPTNHLDWDSLAWLEGWIQDSPATFLIVSHDRMFLDATVTRCYELERGVLSTYPGNYTHAMQIKTTLHEAQERDHQAYQRKAQALAHEMNRARSRGVSAGRFNHKRVGNQSLLGAKNKANAASQTLARQARALEKRLERLQETAPDKPYEDNTLITIDVHEAPQGPTEVLKLQDLTLERDGQVLLDAGALIVRRGERLALLGPNGSGKSTLIQTILGHYEPHSGEVRYGHGLTLYWAGQHGEELQAFETLRDALLNAQPSLTVQEQYILLANLGLPKEPNHAVTRLSGGERTRLSLARLSVTRAHLLLLDEPTNHLDIRATEALEHLLMHYPGTVLFTSHDRRLVERVATRKLLLRHGELQELQNAPATSTITTLRSTRS